MVKVLMLHRVLPIVEKDNYYFRRCTAISQTRFIELLDAIERHKLSTLLPMQANADMTQQGVCITFDDGYADNAWAFEQLLQRGMQATLFPVRNFCCDGFSSIDDAAAWLGQYKSTSSVTRQLIESGRIKALLRRISAERYRFYRREFFGLEHDHPQAAQFLTTKQISYFHQRGIAMGVHGVSHRIWPSLSSEQLTQEVRQSMDWLVSLGIKTIQALCLPHGFMCPGLEKWPGLPVLGVDKAYTTKVYEKEVIRRVWFKQEDNLDELFCC